MNDSNKRVVVNHMVTISRGDLSLFTSIIEMGKIKADTYCPTTEEVTEILGKDLLKYLPFMLWIDETGFSTPENAHLREYLRRFMYDKMKIY